MRSTGLWKSEGRIDNWTDGLTMTWTMDTGHWTDQCLDVWNIVICLSEIIIDAIVIGSISNAAAPSWGDAEELGLCFYHYAHALQSLIWNFLSRAVLTFIVRTCISHCCNPSPWFIALIIVNGLSVRLFSAASHSPNFSLFFPFFSAKCRSFLSKLRTLNWQRRLC